MRVTGIEFASYKLKDVAHIWYSQWKENRGSNEAPITWDFFSETSLDNMFLPIKLREENALEFINMKQGNKRVQEYGMKLKQLSMYGPNMIADYRAQMN